MLKYSRQRECIKSFLSNCTDHPSAETIYFEIKKVFPNISLGTVYRNLSLLSELGEIIKISTSYGPDRFDGNITPHYHFFCKECNCVIDFVIDNSAMSNIVHNNMPENHLFDGQIEGHIIHFYGKCRKCLDMQSNT